MGGSMTYREWIEREAEQNTERQKRREDEPDETTIQAVKKWNS
jgi:hypothetical protein